MLGMHHFGAIHEQSIAIHTITVGGMGMMILAMISRVSLGHTGRPIQVGVLMKFAFIMMLFAVITRLLAPLLTTHYTRLILLSALLWAMAFGCYVIAYTHIVFSKRIDGRDG